MSQSHRLIIISLALLTSFVYFGCSNDFEVNAEPKDIPVVYALLSKSDDVHYLRIERAFLEAGTDALELARQEDQLYYGSEVRVSLKNLSTDDEYALDRVNAADLGVVREPGIFLENPNILYAIAADQLNLDENQSYQLIIDRGNGLPLVTGESQIVGDMTMVRPNPIAAVRSIRMTPNETIRLSLAMDPANGVLYDVILTINYLERAIGDTNFAAKTIEWKAVSESDTGTGSSVSVPGLDFYSFIAGSLGETDPGTIRRMSAIDVKFVAGGKTFADFRRVLEANSGITGAEDAIPNFTNLSEGRGLFSSRNILIEEDFQLTGESLDSLISNPLTRDLNFIR